MPVLPPAPPNAGTAGLFDPLTVRGVRIPNRIGVSPMCMYAATDGRVGDFHVAHLGRFALGGAGLVMMEATAIEPSGRLSHQDSGIWNEAQLPGLSRVAAVISEAGSVPGIQLGHAGRRASVTPPWEGGLPLTAEKESPHGQAWQTIAPSPLPAGPGWPVPQAMTTEDIRRSVELWAEAARRAVLAGFRVLELHGAHGYLLHSFQSPLSNQRTDEYGGDPSRRMRYPREVARAVRAAIGDEMILSYRMSAIDNVPGGITLEDTVACAAMLRDEGVDIIDTSSGGITTDRAEDTRVTRRYAFHADFSRAVRHRASMLTATVGLIVDPDQAEQLIARGDADLILLGRTALDDPNWPLRAHESLAIAGDSPTTVRFSRPLRAWKQRREELHRDGEHPLSRFSARH